MEKQQELKNIDIDEISLVDSPAIKKKFSVIKSEKKPAPKWTSIQKMFFGVTDDEVNELGEEFIDEQIEKTEGKFPSISRAININKKRIENALDMASDEEWLLGKH